MLCYLVRAILDEEAFQQHSIRLDDTQNALLEALDSSVMRGMKKKRVRVSYTEQLVSFIA